MENLNEALGLLAIGMILVFIVLSLVVQLGNLIIRLTNRFMPDEEKPKAGRGNKTNSKKLAAIVAAVDVATQGEGRIDSIQKQ